MLLRVQGCSLGMRVLTGAWGSPISWLTVYRNAFGPGWEQVSPPRHSGIHSRMHWAPGSGMDEGLDVEAPTECTWSCQPRERSCCRALPRDSADPASPLQHPCPDPGQSQSPPHTHHAMQLLLRPGCVMSGQSGTQGARKHRGGGKWDWPRLQPPCHTPSSHQTLPTKHKFRDKIIKMTTAEH